LSHSATPHDADDTDNESEDDNLEDSYLFEGKRLPKELEETTIRTHPDVNMQAAWLQKILGSDDTVPIPAPSAPASSAASATSDQEDEWDVADF
jgi:hypothetical protein